MSIVENLDAVNKALIRAGGEPLKNDWYWSSSEFSSDSAWYANIGNIYLLNLYYKSSTLSYVRPVLAL